jgi:uncharacterized protein (TIGR03084 family)
VDDDVVAALGDQHAELAGILGGLDDADWQRPSRCDGWTVYDVLLHLAQTDEMAIGSVTGTYPETLARLTQGVTSDGGATVDDGADAMVAHERGRPPAELLERWRHAADGLRAELAAADPHKRVTWVAGDVTVRTLATTRLAEAWIHSGDIAAGLDVDLKPSDRLWHIARLAWRTLPYAFGRVGRELTGPVELDLTGPTGDVWRFEPDGAALTIVRGDAVDLCLVAARRVDARDTGLRAEGPDADAVLELVRTYA